MNPVLLSGEVGYESDTKKSKVGDGVKTWNELEYTGMDKVDKVDGKRLSTEDYTTVEKAKLEGIEAGANNYVHPSSHPMSMISGLSTSLEAKVDKVSGKGLSSNDYTTAEKNKLSGIETEANKYVHPATHPSSIITGLGTAATKNTGTGAGSVPLIESNGKLSEAIVPQTMTVENVLTSTSTTSALSAAQGKALNETKVDKVSGKGLSTNDYTTVEKTKLAGIATGANKYVHPATHPVEMITGLDTALNEKVDKVVGKGLSTEDFSSAEKSKLAGITAGANNYVHPATHPYSMITGTPTSLPASGGNSTTADKLKTPRSIALTGGATGTATNFDGSANISIPVTGLNATNLTAGTVPTARMSGAPGAYNINPALAASGVLRANIGAPTLAEMALVEQEFTNKIAFYPYANGLCEISSNGGTTWTTDTSVTEAIWKALVSENNDAAIRFTSDKQYRITITSKSYCYLNAVYIYLSTAGNKAAIRIEKYNNTTNSWSDVIAKSNEASGWPAHFWFQHSTVAFNTATTATSYCGKVRLTIIPTAVSGYEANSLTFYSLRWYGGYPGTDRRTIYSWDSDKNVTFPAALKAPTVYDNGQRVYSPSNKPTASNVTGLGTAAMKNTGTSSGQVPVIGSNGKLPVAIVPPILTVENVLTSTSTANALSAAQGKALNDIKVDRVSGKGLSANDYTTAEKTKLAGIATGANNYTHPATHPASMITGLPTSMPADGGTADKVKNKLTAGSKSYDGSAAVTLTAADLGALTSIPATYVTETEYAAASKGGVVKSSTATDKVKVETDGTMSLNTVSGGKVSGAVASATSATNATTATKLSTSAGSATQPVYFSGGKPVATTYTLGASVPSGAKFTDTVYTLPIASTTLGGVKTTSAVTSTSGLTACPIISGVPYYKDTNTTYTLSSFGVTATASELNYVKGVTSSIQTQLNAKATTQYVDNAITSAIGNAIGGSY